MMYVITGATGHVGSAAAHALLDAGKQVRAIARNASRLKTLQDRGAEILPGSLLDTDFLYRAFQTATAVLTMIPEDVTANDLRRNQDMIGDAITSALRLSRVRHIVNLSSAGGELPEGTGPIAGLHRQEERLNQIEEINVLHLRPNYFMENFLISIPLIKNMNMMATPIKGDLPIAMIATRDIGAYAANCLMRLDFSGRRVIDLLGPQDLTMTEAARILGSSVGKPDLQYVQVPYDQAIQGMIMAGMSSDVAQSINEMAKAMNDGLIRPVPRTAENTTPTTLEEFVRTVFAPAFSSNV